MQIFHHFGIGISEEDTFKFAELGVQLKGGQALQGRIFTSLQVSEDDPRWKEIRKLVENFKVTDFVYTRFSQAELDEAPSLQILASGHTGYPQPDAHFGFLEATYDLSDYCQQCGIGYRQIRPFRFKTVPDLRRKITQLNWVFDEFFTDRDNWQKVFLPLGIDCWPVLLHKSGEEIESLVQLKISHRTGLEKSETTTSCSACGRPKAQLSMRGFAPKPTNIPASIFRSAQYFGSGGQAFHRVFVEAALYREIAKSGLRGVEFYPCARDA